MIQDSGDKQPWETVGANEDPTEAFLNKTLQHIHAVNKFAAKIGRSYPHHDEDKLTALLHGYSLLCVDNKEITETQQKELNLVTGIHVYNNQHHPEHWVSGFEPLKFDRKAPQKNLSAVKMSKPAIEEMMADWCAVSELCGNDPYSWMNDTCSTEADGCRWIFTQEQLDYMKDLLDVMW